MHRRLWIGLSALGAVGGCASSPPRPFASVSSVVQHQAGLAVTRPASTRGAITPPPEWLSQQLTVDAAVRIALACNRHLAATYDTLDLSQADLTQAGLLKNPALDLSVRFPDRSPRKTYLDFGITDSLVDLLLIGARKRLAELALSQAQATAAHQILQAVAEVRSAYFAAVAAEQTRSLRQTIVDAANAADVAADQLRQAGNLSPIEPLRTHVETLRAQGDLIAADEAVAATRQKLAALLGIDGSQTRWSLADHLPDVPPAITPADFNTLALRQRQDLAASKVAVKLAARTVGVTVDERFFGETAIGTQAERETDGQWRIGPSIVLPIPLFDQGQAAIARARAELQRSADEYQALRIDVLSQVGTAQARLDASRASAALCRDQILPTQQTLIDQTQLRYNGMYDSVFVLLDAKRSQVESSIQYVEALREYWTAKAELDAAVGGQLPTTPATQRKEMEPADMENMDMHMEH